MYNKTSKLITFFIIFISIALIASYFLFSTYRNTQQAREEKQEITQLKNTEKLLSQMTLEEKVGQMFMVGFWGTEPDYYITKMITERNIGGVILFAYNIESKEQIETLTQTLQTLSTKTPLLISIDQEGGVVSRLKTNIVSETTAQSEITSIQQAYDIAKKRGEELKALGINMNFSPVLDNIQQKKSFMYDRTFRGDISSLGSSMVSGYTDGKVISVPKHFPGHSEDTTDSHKDLPEVNITESNFDTYTSQFISVIETGNPEALMVGHILFPQIDGKYPSSISYKIITEILKERLGFDGVVISDDMLMGALTKDLTISQSAIQAVIAGEDILIYSGEPEKQVQAYNAILEAVNQGKITTERIDESVLKILTLKSKIFNL